MLFCREFENVVSHVFLVLVFWANTAAGATVFAFCNYGCVLDLQLVVDWCWLEPVCFVWLVICVLYS